MRDDSTSSPTVDPVFPDWMSQDLLEETKAVWTSEYGENLTTTEAVGLLQTLIGVFEIIEEIESENG